MSNKFVEFAQAVGTDVKDLKNNKADKTELANIQNKLNDVVNAEALNNAINGLKTEILGDGVPEQLNTLKEIADSITQMNSDTDSAVVQKITELGQRIDTINNTDLVATYNEAKGI